MTFYIDGVFFYWHADTSDCDFVLKNEIVAFDMSQETFSMTKVPDKCCVESNNYRRWRTLTELKKRVAMIRYTSESSNITCNLWVLLELVLRSRGPNSLPLYLHRFWDVRWGYGRTVSSF